MRVIAGEAKGRQLTAVPGKTTRPTTDKVKEAMFSMIGPYFDGGMALDLFAGTGGLGIEAWSRGIEKVISIEKEKLSHETLRHNVTTVGATNSFEIYKNDANRALKLLAKRSLQFKLVFLDPPYSMTDMDKYLEEIETLQLIESDGLVVVEHDAKVTYAELIGRFERIKKQQYRDIAVSIYRYTNEIEQGV